MATTRSRFATAEHLGHLLDRLRAALWPPRAPDDVTGPPTDPRAAWLHQLQRTGALLELARTVIATDGFTHGAWFAVATTSGGARLVNGADALPFRDPSRPVVNACLVGTLVRLAEDPDRPGTLGDAWRCVDELYEAVHEQRGHTSMPPGRAYSAAERRLRLRELTVWNDDRQRSRADVLDLLDRAISRTILGACRGD